MDEQSVIQGNVKRERKVRRMPDAIVFLTVVFGLLALLSVTLSYQRGNGALAEGLHSTLGLLWQILPLLVLALVCAGFARVLLAGARAPEEHAMKLSVRISTGIFIVLLAACLAIAWRRQDNSLTRGLEETWRMLRDTWLLLVVAWIFAGYIGVLLPEDFVRDWLGRQSGIKGILFACAAGGLTPGGPFVSLPIAAELYRVGAGEGVIVAYLSAWSLYAFGRIPFEISFLDVRLTAIRFVSVLVFPPIAGLIAKLIFERNGQ